MKDDMIKNKKRLYELAESVGGRIALRYLDNVPEWSLTFNTDDINDYELLNHAFDWTSTEDVDVNYWYRLSCKIDKYLKEEKTNELGKS